MIGFGKYRNMTHQEFIIEMKKKTFDTNMYVNWLFENNKNWMESFDSEMISELESIYYSTPIIFKYGKFKNQPISDIKHNSNLSRCNAITQKLPNSTTECDSKIKSYSKWYLKTFLSAEIFKRINPITKKIVEKKYKLGLECL